ncbi:hypothetical protein PoB_004478600 [Plakobranchus ocellatus]|uniref:Uncharacterized protein n=1 Tax=Plakobranchus ocellatus TaxID=259542 RepID=A0AAV4B4L4_9GAST|nr:hypothetical protein PoB_004478600 [Plakobranchus ocellatus]
MENKSGSTPSEISTRKEKLGNPGDLVFNEFSSRLPLAGDWLSELSRASSGWSLIDRPATGERYGSPARQKSAVSKEDNCIVNRGYRSCHREQTC